MGKNRILPVIVLMGASTIFPAHSQPSAFYDGFEEQVNKWKLDINDEADHERNDSLVQIEQKKNALINQSGEHARDGRLSLKMTLPHEFGSFRTEVSLPGVPMGSEYWYGFSIYIPKDWQVDSEGNILAQWHALMGREHKEKHHPGDHTGKPPVAIAVQDNNWNITFNWNSNGSESGGKDAGHLKLDLGPIKLGTWTDFVAHAKWLPNDNGYFQLWKDGKLVTDRKGAVEYSGNPNGPYFKLGIYHPEWKTFHPEGFKNDTNVTRSVIVYDDEVRITAAPGTYEDVNPRGELPQ